MKLIDRWAAGSLADLDGLQTVRVIATIEPRCNLRCEHCYWSHDLHGNLASDWSDSISFLKQICTPLFFAGRILNERGAKFLRQVIERKAVSELNIVDNGLTILDYPEFLSQYSTINISIDGWKESHDRQRNRKGLFDDVWGTVLTIKEHGLDPIISAALSPLTLDNWDKFENLLISHDVPMSSTLVWNLPETEKRGKAVFASRDKLRDAFRTLVEGMPKLVNIYSIDYVELLSDILAQYKWHPDKEVGDCFKAVLPSGTVIVYRPTSLTSVAELSLQWDGIYYVPSTYGPGWRKDLVDSRFFDSVRLQNKKELSVWSKIAPIAQHIERR